MEAESGAGDDGGGEGEGEAQAGCANVGRLAGEIAGCARVIHLGGALLLDSQSPAALGWVSLGWRWASMEKGHHGRVIGANCD